jgi:glycosyltransferase involved in cell wall biosynthesis
MRFAAHGFLSDGAGSSASAMGLLLRELLTLGHEVHFFGIPGFTEAPSLRSFPSYRYTALRLEALERAWEPVRRIPSALPSAAYSQFVHAAYQREAIHQIEAVSRQRPFDVVLCTDTLELWPSTLPIVSWPQSAPQTEWAALRSPDIAQRVRGAAGWAHLAAVEAFYAFRWLQARVGWRASDFILCGSRWSEAAWRNFGVPGSRVRAMPYPIDLELFTLARTRSPGQGVAFLWLGRAVPRKRFDLFLGAFERLASQRDDVRAIVVGDLSPDRSAAPALARSPVRQRIEQRAAVPRAEIPALLAKVDVLVQPSENENFGFSVAEALASGCPVVVGPTNGTGDYAGAARFAFDAYTREAVADAMGRAADAVLSNPVAVAEAAQHAAQALDSARVVNELVRLCQDVASKRKRRPLLRFHARGSAS